MSDLFDDANPLNVKEGFKNIKTSNKLLLENSYSIKDLEQKLKNDYAAHREFRDKLGNPNPKKVKSAFLKTIYGLLNGQKEKEGKELLKIQEELLTKVLDSFDDNEKNNELFKLGAGKTPDVVEDFIIYIVDYLNGDLDNDLIKSIISKIETNVKLNGEKTKAKKDLVGLITRDEIKVMEALSSLILKDYKEQLELDFKTKHNIPIKDKKVKVGIEENDIEKLSNILDIKYSIELIKN